MMEMYSFVRVSGRPYGTPCQPSTTCGPDGPRPRMKRPFDSASSVIAVIAAAAGVSDKDVVAVADPMAAWTDRMAGNHHVLPSDRLLDAVREVADVEQLAAGRFIARFVAQGFDPTHPRAHAVRDLLIATEDARIATGALTPAGLRLVARIPSPV